VLPEAQNDGSGTGTVQATRESVASASSDVAACSSIKDKAIAALPTEMAEMAKDTKRKARSSDRGWKYGFWQDIAKEMVQCIFLPTIVLGLGQHRFWEENLNIITPPPSLICSVNNNSRGATSNERLKNQKNTKITI
jgi:hypothetical protein